MTEQDEASEVVASANIIAGYVFAGGVPEFVPDERTGGLLTPRTIGDEIPTEALVSYEHWRASVAAGEPRAMATYAKLLPGRPSELALTYLADRIDAPEPKEERAIVASIFGGRYAPVVQRVMRDEFMRRRDETEHALERVRVRLRLNCATPTDAARIHRCAAETATLEMLVAWVFEYDRNTCFHVEVLKCRIVNAKTPHVCDFTGIQIEPGEQYILSIVRERNGSVRLSATSKTAIWCKYVLGDLVLSAYVIGPDDERPAAKDS